MVDTLYLLKYKEKEESDKETECILVTNVFSYCDYSSHILAVIKTERRRVTRDELHKA